MLGNWVFENGLKRKFGPKFRLKFNFCQEVKFGQNSKFQILNFEF